MLAAKSTVGVGSSFVTGILALALLVGSVGLFAQPVLKQIGAVHVRMTVAKICQLETLPPESRLARPTSMVVDDAGLLYIADPGRGVLEQWDPKTCAVVRSVPIVSAGLNEPYGMVRRADGVMYALDAATGGVVVISPDLKPIQNLFCSGAAPYQPRGLAIDPDGVFYMANTGGSEIYRCGADGQLLTRIGSPGKDAGKLQDPGALAVDNRGLFVADVNNERVQLFGRDGKYIDSWPAAVSKISIGPGGEVYGYAPQSGAIMVLAPDSRGFVTATKADDTPVAFGGNDDGVLVAAPDGRVYLARPDAVITLEPAH